VFNFFYRTQHNYLSIKVTDNQAFKSLKKLYHSAQQKNEKLFVFFNFKLPTFTAANKQCPQIADF